MHTICVFCLHEMCKFVIVKYFPTNFRLRYTWLRNSIYKILFVNWLAWFRVFSIWFVASHLYLSLSYVLFDSFFKLKFKVILFNSLEFRSHVATCVFHFDDVFVCLNVLYVNWNAFQNVCKLQRGPYYLFCLCSCCCCCWENDDFSSSLC